MNKFPLSFLFSGFEHVPFPINLGNLILRIYFGLVIALAHGTVNCPPLEGFIQAINAMGFPAPTFFAWEKARKGIYDLSALHKGLNKKQIDSCFEKLDKDHYQVRDEIKRMIHFQHHNLLEPLPSTTRFNIILCRNVIIYFTEKRKREILEKFAQKLLPDGFYLSGPSEPITQYTSRLVQESFMGSIYYRPGNA